MTLDLQLPSSRARALALLLLTPAYMVIGVMHFTHTAWFVAIMPPWIPAHELMVWISGAAELLLGAAALVPATRRLAGYGIVALLIAVFPANIHMAMEAERFAAELEIPEWSLYTRLLYQVVLAAWALWATKPEVSAA